MKRLLYLAVSVMLAVMVSCEKEGESEKAKITKKLCNEWVFTNEAIDLEVYMGFYKDGTFKLYHRGGTSRFDYHEGTWQLEKNILSGKYSDGKEWGASYEVAFYDKFMTLTTMTEIKETCTYTQTVIPDSVAESSGSDLRMLNSQPQYRWL